jgi:hypothetical protein
MTTTKAPFSLSELTNNVESLSSINEILDLYYEVSITKEQSNLSVLVPLLETKMKDITHLYKDLEPQLKINREQFEDLMKKTLDVVGLSGTILSIASSFDNGSQIYGLANKLYNDARELGKALEGILLTIIDHETKALNLNLGHYMATHTIIKEMLEKDLHKYDWIKEQLKTINDNQTAYQRSVSSTAVRSEVATFFKKFYTLQKQAQELGTYVNHVVASNKLISPFLVNNVNQLDEKFEIVLKEFNTTINSIYQSEAKQQKIIEAIQVSQAIHDKLTDHLPVQHADEINP